MALKAQVTEGAQALSTLLRQRAELDVDRQLAQLGLPFVAVVVTDSSLAEEVNLEWAAVSPELGKWIRASVARRALGAGRAFFTQETAMQVNLTPGYHLEITRAS